MAKDFGADGLHFLLFQGMGVPRFKGGSSCPVCPMLEDFDPHEINLPLFPAVLTPRIKYLGNRTVGPMLEHSVNDTSLLFQYFNMFKP